MSAVDPVEERIARYMAAEDWLEDKNNDAWWNSRLAAFRDQYRASAREIIAIVHEGAPPKRAPKQRGPRPLKQAEAEPRKEKP